MGPWEEAKPTELAWLFRGSSSSRGSAWAETDSAPTQCCDAQNQGRGLGGDACLQAKGLTTPGDLGLGGVLCVAAVRPPHRWGPARTDRGV